MPNLERARPFHIDRGSEVGVVLLHGFTGAPQEVEPLGEFLGQAGISSMGPMLPGHGTSVWALNRTRWPDWARAASETLEEAFDRWSRVYVGGLSMGGALALHLAAHRGDRLGGAISLAAPIRLRGFGARLVPLLAPILPAVPKGRGSGIAADPSGRTRVSYDWRPLSAVQELHRMLDHIRDDLPEVRCPVLLLHSAGDRTIPSADMEEIYDRVTSRQKRKVMLTRSDHVITQDVERDRVMEEVLAFIRASA